MSQKFKKILAILSALALIALVFLFNINQEKTITDSIYIRTSISEDYRSILFEVKMLPERKGSEIKCFRITDIKEGSKFLQTRLFKDDCLVTIKSYKVDPVTVIPLETPEVVRLNSPNSLQRLMLVLYMPHKVELEFLRNKDRYFRTYKIDYTYP